MEIWIKRVEQFAELVHKLTLLALEIGSLIAVIKMIANG